MSGFPLSEAFGGGSQKGDPQGGSGKEEGRGAVLAGISKTQCPAKKIGEFSGGVVGKPLNIGYKKPLAGGDYFPVAEGL